MQNANILIVDDEIDVIQALKMRLETEGHRALSASNGVEALQVLGQMNVDVILADVMMPKLDGFGLTRRVREDPRWFGTQVLLFSCNDDPSARKLALEFGALDYLSKTLGGRAIVSRINEVLNLLESTGLTRWRRPDYEQAERDLTEQLRAISANSVEMDGSLRFASGSEFTPGSVRDAVGVEAIGDLRNLAETLRRYTMAGDKRRQDSTT